MDSQNGTVPQVAKPARKAHELLKQFASGSTLRNITPVEGDGVPPGLCVRVLTFTEAKSLQAIGDEFARLYAEAIRGDADAPSEPSKADISVVSAAVQVAHIAVDEDGAPIFRPADDVALPEGAPEVPHGFGKITEKGKLWVGMLQVLAFVPVPAIVLIAKTATKAIDEQWTALGKGSSAANISSS